MGTSGAAAGPVHPAHGHLVATKRGFRNIALEGYSEDDNQDGFVDPIGHAAPVAVAPALTYAHVPAVTYAHAPAVTHTYTHHVGNLVHTYGHPLGYGFGLPVVAAAAPAAAEEAAEDVVDA